MEMQNPEISPEMAERIEAAKRETDLFLQEHPEFHRSEKNKGLMLGWLEQHDLSLTRARLESAFADIRGQLELSPEQIATNARANAEAKEFEETRALVSSLSADAYRKRYESDPRFRSLVDRLYESQTAEGARRVRLSMHLGAMR